MELSGKVALITGGARMGLSVARALTQKGCAIVFTWRSSRAAAETSVNALKVDGVRAFAVRCELSNPASVQRMIREISRRLGRLDVLVNLASIYEKTPPGQSALEVWNSHLRNNAQSAYVLSTGAAPLMRQKGGGRMIHIADWTSASDRPRYPDYGAYYVSKKAVEGVVETLALELAPAILVNAIAPGPILPPKGMTRTEDAVVRRTTPLRRWGGPEEIAKAVVFLAETDFVTGEVLRVDGGRHLY